MALIPAVHSGRSKYETLIVTIAVLLVLAVSFGLYSGRSGASKGKELIVELGALRTGIVLYTMVNKARPPSLEALFSETYDSGSGERLQFVSGVYRDDGGRIIDPFGQQYVYDSEIGWVRSTAPGYETW